MRNSLVPQVQGLAYGVSSLHRCLLDQFIDRSVHSFVFHSSVFRRRVSTARQSRPSVLVLLLIQCFSELLLKGTARRATWLSNERERWSRAYCCWVRSFRRDSISCCCRRAFSFSLKACSSLTSNVWTSIQITSSPTSLPRNQSKFERLPKCHRNRFLFSNSCEDRLPRTNEKSIEGPSRKLAPYFLMDFSLKRLILMF